eukprot:266719-Chlamydomonas_euryale.AAC.3
MSSAACVRRHAHHAVSDVRQNRRRRTRPLFGALPSFPQKTQGMTRSLVIVPGYASMLGRGNKRGAVGGKGEGATIEVARAKLVTCAHARTHAKRVEHSDMHMHEHACAACKLLSPAAIGAEAWDVGKFTSTQQSHRTGRMCREDVIAFLHTERMRSG